MEVNVKDSITSASNSSSEVAATYNLDLLTGEVNIANDSCGSVTVSTNSTSVVQDATTQDSLGSENANAPPQDKPLTQRVKSDKCKTENGQLDMKYYMPLGSVTFLTMPGSQPLPPEMWQESNSPPDSMPGEHPMFRSLSILLSRSLIRICTGRNKTSDSLATIRVWVLPDDVVLSLIPKSYRQKYRAPIRTLMDSLDVSSRGWDGCASVNSTEFGYGSRSAEDDSLFYIFNTLRSPCPVSIGIKDSYAKAAVEGLLHGEPVIPGLKTKLYPYQSRSAAMMIQREVKPGRMLDPRLETMTSPVGTVFYYDREAVTILSERREYDEARGGILAETVNT